MGKRADDADANLRNWPLVRVHDSELASIEWRHASTRCVSLSEDSPAASGQAMWVGLVNGERCGLRWPWAVIEPGVVAVDNPMMIESNLLIEGKDGPIYGLVLPQLMRMVMTIDWYPQVAQTVSRRRNLPSVAQVFVGQYRH